MFEVVRPLAPDPLLGIMVAFAQDQNPLKVDLGVGVYKDEAGITPVFASVKTAEKEYLAAQTSKSYIGPAGSAEFNRLHSALVFGDSNAALTDKRIAVVQTPGGCGALRVAAEFIQRCRSNTTVWVSDPTWANHEPLLGDAGLTLDYYPYYDGKNRKVNFEGMMACLERAQKQDVVLLHASCHNPSGADLSQEQWRAVTELAERKGFTVFIDFAYQGFGKGLDEDAYGVRLMAERLPELIVASSCSKNFGLYRERVGSLCILTQSAENAVAVTTHLNKIVRGIYSMPPAHGAAIVETLLNNAKLRSDWEKELAYVRARIIGLRKDLADALGVALGDDRFRFIEDQSGMFSFLGLNKDQVIALQQQFSIYMAGTSRINVAGLKPKDIDYVAKAVASIL